MNTYTTVFGGSTIYPSDVSYLALDLDANIELEWPLEANPGPNVVARIIDVDASGSYSITMPPADQTGVGQTVLFNNVGASTFTVLDNDGGTIGSMASGTQWQIYLTSNADAAGTWKIFRYGAATSTAQAAALAGYGITATGALLSQSMPATLLSMDYTIGSTDRAKMFVWTGALGTLTLPAAATAGDGWNFLARNGGTGDLTLDPPGGELINDESSLVLQPGDSVMVGTDGLDFYTIGLGQDAVFAFDYTVISVDGLSGNYTLSGSELNRIAYSFTGALAGNISIVVPPTVQQYWIANNTTGAYTLTVKISGSTGTAVAQGARAILYSNSADVVSADTSGVATPISIANGGTGATTASGARINLGGTATGIAVFTAASALAGRTALSAASSGANSDITSLTGLTTPLTVAQGGTGAATLTGVIKGTGTAALEPAISGTDYLAPGSANTFTAKQTFNGTSSTVSSEFTNIVETTTITAAAPSATTNYDVTTQSVQQYTSNGANNWVTNLRASSGTNLDAVMNTGESITVALITTMGATPYYCTAVNVDGTAVGVTTKWLGAAPSAGYASADNIYTFTVTKTGSATFTVRASLTAWS